MRDAEETCHFPIRQAVVASPEQNARQRYSVLIRSRLTKPNTYRRPARYTAPVPDFLCNAAQSFGKEWETVCASGLTGTTATNPKQEKEIKL